MVVRYALFKRAMDVVVSLILLLLFLPFGVAIALMVALETPGPVFFRQTRIGRHTREFHILKFRSMVQNAAVTGPYHTAANDVRVTRMGKLLRSTSLDEIPQLWNVLVGEMSLIGPRPDTPAQQTLYTPQDWMARHQVRPGITGLAQVSGRSALSPQERLRLDLDYAAQHNWTMDRRILWQTAQQVLRKVGVN